MRKKKIKIAVITATVVVLVGLTGVVVSEAREREKYNDLVSKALSEFEANNYEEAKNLYIESTNIKENPEVNKKLEEISSIEVQEKNIKLATELYNEGKLEEALDILNTTNEGTVDIINTELNSLKDKINKGIEEKKEAERIAKEKEEERKKAEAEKKRLEEEKQRIEQEEATKKEQELKENANKQASLKTYYYKTNISDSERGKKPISPYITYGEAENIIAKAYFKRYPEHSGENLFMYITPADGSFYGNIFFNGELTRTYELNALNGDMVSDSKIPDYTYEYPEGTPRNNASIKF